MPLDFAPEDEDVLATNGVRIENTLGDTFDFTDFDMLSSVRTTDMHITASNGASFDSLVSSGGGGGGPPFAGTSQQFDFLASNEFDNVEWVEISFDTTGGSGPNVYLDNFEFEL